MDLNEKKHLLSVGLSGLLSVTSFISFAVSPADSYFLLVAGVGFLSLAGVVYYFGTAYAKLAKESSKIRLSARRSQNKANYFESILQDSSDIIFTIDVDGFILKFNKGAEANFGYSQMEIVGKPFRKLFINEADEQKVYDLVLREGRVTNLEFAMKTAEGEPIFVNLSVSEMKNDTGKIIGLVATCKNITEKKKLEQELMQKNELLERLAVTDSLTGLLNSRTFYDNLKKEYSRLKRAGSGRLTVMMIDLDRFKIYNDTHGHQAGDRVLRVVGQIIASSVRQDIDTGYRYGGDEFTLILPNTDREQANNVADRIRRGFEACNFHPTSLSIGMADTDGADEKEELVKRADEEMYRNKKHAR